MAQKSTQAEFIINANVKHNNYYSYSKTVYVSSKSKIIITCPLHGDFLQIPTNHTFGQGCPKCGRDRSAKAQTKSITTFIEEAVIVHNSKYTYPNAVYITDRAKLAIECPIHGEFWQVAGDHLTGKGCIHCRNELMGWSRDRYAGNPAILYIIKLIGGQYKVGITSRAGIDIRYSQEDPLLIKEKLLEVSVINGATAWDLEKDILRHFRDYKYSGPQIFKYTKNSEILAINPYTYTINKLKELNAI